MASPTSANFQFLAAHDTLPQTVLAVSALLIGCGSAGYAVDSATSACRQNPEYCALVAGKETVVPTTIRGGAEVASMAATLQVLTPKTQSDIESDLVECVEWADAKGPAGARWTGRRGWPALPPLLSGHLRPGDGR